MQDNKNRKVVVKVVTSFVIEEDDLEENTKEWSDEDLIQYGFDRVEELGGAKGVVETFDGEINVVVV